MNGSRCGMINFVHLGLGGDGAVAPTGVPRHAVMAEVVGLVIVTAGEAEHAIASDRGAYAPGR